MSSRNITRHATPPTRDARETAQPTAAAQPEPAAKRTKYVQPELLPSFAKILEPHRAAILPDEMAARLLDIQAQFEALDVQILDTSHDSVVRKLKAAKTAAAADPSPANLTDATGDRETLLIEARQRKKLLRVVRANLFEELAPFLTAVVAAAVSILEAELAVFEKHEKNLAELLSLPFLMSQALSAAYFGVERLRATRFFVPQSPISALAGIVAL